MESNTTRTSLKDSIVTIPLVYKLIQVPFVEGKLAPVREEIQQAKGKRVLDVGCGPGTNCKFFGESDYTGIDIEPKYINHAREKYQRNFLVGDASKLSSIFEQPFDFILVNSLTHHLDDEKFAGLITESKKVLAPGGTLCVVDIVNDTKHWLSTALTKADRGDFVRPYTKNVEAWTSSYSEIRLGRFQLYLFGFTCAELFYFVGSSK